MRKRLAGTFVLGALAFAGVALGAVALPGAATFTDPAGDDNAAPDITSVSVVASSPAAVTLKVAVANYPQLEGRAWFNLYFDLDANPETGILGSEALVRYLSDDTVQVLAASGFTWVTRPTTGVTASYAAGELTLGIPRATLGGADPLGVMVISGRQQSAGAAVYLASDFAPDDGHLSWAGSATPSSPDPEDDHEAAPDITTVRVSDTKNGWIRFAITTANFPKLREDSVVAVLVDSDSRKATGNLGADYAIGHVAGGVFIERWNESRRRWVDIPGRALVRTSNANRVVTIDVHRSELGDLDRLGFRLMAATMHFPTGLTYAVDLAPNDILQTWRYRLTETAPMRLLAGKTAFQARPRAATPSTVSVPVRRADTGRAITSGTVSCLVRVDGKRVQAKGSVRAGRGQCAFRLRAKGVTVSGELVVRSLRTSVKKPFSFRVR